MNKDKIIAKAVEVYSTANDENNAVIKNIRRKFKAMQDERILQVMREGWKPEYNEYVPEEVIDFLFPEKVNAKKYSIITDGETVYSTDSRKKAWNEYKTYRDWYSHKYKKTLCLFRNDESKTLAFDSHEEYDK